MAVGRTDQIRGGVGAVGNKFEKSLGPSVSSMNTVVSSSCLDDTPWVTRAGASCSITVVGLGYNVVDVLAGGGACSTVFMGVLHIKVSVVVENGSQPGGRLYCPIYKGGRLFW